MSGNCDQCVVFGPVPSRRLGRSLGVNNIPLKHCSYSCIYCQLGSGRVVESARRRFYEPSEIYEAAEKKLAEASLKNEAVDYLSFVPDGEPTLDVNLGECINLLRRTGVKTAVITNASLLWKDDVRDDLMNADWVSVKVDAVSAKVWRFINRPYRGLDINRIHEGMLEFAGSYRGYLATETMLVTGVNDGADEVSAVADLIGSLKPRKSYISIPLRPPAEKRVSMPDESSVNMAWQIFTTRGLSTECLTGYEGNAFAQTGDIIDDILGITSVHPMREEALRCMLSEAGSDWVVVEELIREDKIFVTDYNGINYYMKRFKTNGE